MTSNGAKIVLILEQGQKKNSVEITASTIEDSNITLQ